MGPSGQTSMQMTSPQKSEKKTPWNPSKEMLFSSKDEIILSL
jgi:hypothetical protein